MFDLPSAMKLFLEASAPMIERERQLASGNLAFDNADDVRNFIEEMTGSKDTAEATVLAWRERRMERGEDMK